MNNDEIVKRLDEIMGHNVNIDTAIQLKKLRDKLKPKPEFINGEIVYLEENIKRFNSYTMNFEKCERLEKLPIHFIPWSGGDRPCIGLVVVKFRGGGNNTYPLYKVQRSECLVWNHGKIEEAIDIIGYQPIEDLEEE